MSILDFFNKMYHPMDELKKDLEIEMMNEHMLDEVEKLKKESAQT